MFDRSKQLAVAGMVGLGGLMAATGASAAVTVTEVVSEIEGAAAPIAAIGSAVLIIFVGLKVYKWVRRAL